MSVCGCIINESKKRERKNSEYEEVSVKIKPEFYVSPFKK